MSVFDDLYDAFILVIVAPALPPGGPASQAIYGAARWGGDSGGTGGTPGGVAGGGGNSGRPPQRMK
jgi:hypothetical protein